MKYRSIFFLEGVIDTAESDLYFDLISKISLMCIGFLSGDVGCNINTLSTFDNLFKACKTGSIPFVSSFANSVGLLKGTSAKNDLAISAISSSSVETITLST